MLSRRAACSCVILTSSLALHTHWLSRVRSSFDNGMISCYLLTRAREVRPWTEPSVCPCTKVGILHDEGKTGHWKIEKRAVWRSAACRLLRPGQPTPMLRLPGFRKRRCRTQQTSCSHARVGGGPHRHANGTRRGRRAKESGRAPSGAGSFAGTDGKRKSVAEGRRRLGNDRREHPNQGHRHHHSTPPAVKG
jgi:hypothetical protein